MGETERDKEQKAEALEIIREQLGIEGELVGLYEESERETENKAMKRIMQMFRLDSQRHINILQAAIEIIEGEDVFIEDRIPLNETLKKHLALEAEALKKANNLLKKQWIDETKGLKNLIEMWRDDEKRHHNALKKMINKPYFRLAANDMIGIFRDEAFLEDRYRKSKEYRARRDEA
jgi:hypothetical protein